MFGVLELLGKANICLNYIFYSLRLFITLLCADSTGVSYWFASERTKYLVVEGGVLGFKAVFHHQYEAAQVWVAAKGRFVSWQLPACLSVLLQGCLD